MKVEIDGVQYVPKRKPPNTNMFSSALRQLREESKQTLEDVCEAVDISKTYLWEMETGAATTPSFWIVAALASHYGVSLDYFAELRH